MSRANSDDSPSKPPQGESQPVARSPDKAASRRSTINRICIAIIVTGVAYIALSLWNQWRRRDAGRPEPGASLILHQPVVRVPIRLEGRPIVAVTINDRGPYRFLLDTGAASVHVSRHLAKELDLPIQPGTRTETNAAGETNVCQLVKVRSLRMGEAELTDFVANMHPPREALEQHDGVVGFSMFQGCLVTLDFPAGQLTIKRGSLPPADGKEILPLVSGRSVPTVEVFVSDKPMELVIDTGSSGGIGVPERVSRTLSYDSAAFDTEARSSGDPIVARHARMAGEMRVGRHRIDSPIVSWLPGKKGHAGFGMKVLRHFVLTFDSANRTVRFARNSEDPIQMRGFRTIGLVFCFRKGKRTAKATIHGVNPATPAAGLDVKVGDEVLSANGRPFVEFTDAAMKELFGRVDTVTLELKRGDRQFTVDVPVVERP